jgi:hypothetical protein
MKSKRRNNVLDLGLAVELVLVLVLALIVLTFLAGIWT